MRTQIILLRRLGDGTYERYDDYPVFSSDDLIYLEDIGPCEQAVGRVHLGDETVQDRPILIQKREQLTRTFITAEDLVRY